MFVTGTALSALKKWLEIRQEIDGAEKYQCGFHNYSTVMAKRADIQFVAQNLGHKDIDTTVGNYVNASFGVGELLRNM